MKHTLIAQVLVATAGLAAAGCAGSRSSDIEFARQMDPFDKSMLDEKVEAMTALGLFDPDNESSPGVGEMAPDFALAPLRFYDFALDERPITKDNAGELFEPVRLSAFRGKLPVVLIFGSYT